MSDEPIIRVRPHDPADAHLADGMSAISTYFMQRREAFGQLYGGERWDPETRALTVTMPALRLDHNAIREGVRSPDWRSRFTEELRRRTAEQRGKVEQEAAWAILTEALNRIDELEAELANRSLAPALGRKEETT